jgi:hypothetical protein
MSELNQEAKNEIGRLKESDYTLSSYRNPTLILGAASGLQISEEHKIAFLEGIDAEHKELLNIQIGKCFGPHINSYHNKIFKRFLYETSIPIMIFLTENKIDCEITAGETHFVLDSQFTWEYFHKTLPVAFGVGCTLSSKNKLVEKFKALGFHITEGHSSAPCTSFFARNDVFVREFEDKLPADKPD